MAWELHSHESRRDAIGSRSTGTRLPGQGEICDVIMEMVYFDWSDAVSGQSTAVNMFASLLKNKQEVTQQQGK